MSGERTAAHPAQHDPLPEPAELAARLQAAVDELLAALSLEACGPDSFRGGTERGRFPRLFGGQVLAQALVAAARSVHDDKVPHSLHAYFLAAGETGTPIAFEVERVREGRSFAARRVTALQRERPILQLAASFHVDEPGHEHDAPGPRVAGPDDMPTLGERVAALPGGPPPEARAWLSQPPPLEFRVDQPPGFMGGAATLAARRIWLRVPRRLPDDPLLHHALLAYASDYLLLDVATRPHRHEGPMLATSLDHALWLHRPARLDEWLLYEQQSPVARAARGLAQGVLRDRAGRRVASVAQEILMRPQPPG